MSYPIPNNSTDLSGQTALVTGASSGLGRRFAKVLAACGAKVAVTGRRMDRLQEVAAEIRADGGIAEPLALDVTDADQLIAVVEQAQQALGLVTILVNNAGIPDAQRATKMPLDLIDRVLDTNLRAPFILSCEVARRLMEAKSPGRMVNISSMAAFEYRGGGAALYSVSKAGIARMTEALAVEWAGSTSTSTASPPAPSPRKCSTACSSGWGTSQRVSPAPAWAIRRNSTRPCSISSRRLRTPSPGR